MARGRRGGGQGRPHHGWALIGLHWLTLLVIAAAYVLGSILDGMALSPAKLQVYAWHKWLGILVLLSLPLRLVLRLFDRLPADSALKAWEAQTAEVVHLALYLSLAVVPLTGWLQSSAEGFPVVLFKLWQLPDLVAKDAHMAKVWREAHETLVNLMLALVALHAAAALYHHHFRRDAVLVRMLPGLRRRP